MQVCIIFYKSYLAQKLSTAVRFAAKLYDWDVENMQNFMQFSENETMKVLTDSIKCKRM